jgi:hypothetical protein
VRELKMKKAVILLVLGMVLVGMAPIAVSDGPWTEENGDNNPGGYEDDGNHEEQAQFGDMLQPDGQSQFGTGEPQNEHDG